MRLPQESKTKFLLFQFTISLRLLLASVVRTGSDYKVTKKTPETPVFSIDQISSSIKPSFCVAMKIPALLQTDTNTCHYY